MTIVCKKIFYSPSYTITAHSFETTRKSGWIAESLAHERIALHRLTLEAACACT